MAEDSRSLTALGCEGQHVEVMPVEDHEAAVREERERRQRAEAQLAQCYRLTGADPDGRDVEPLESLARWLADLDESERRTVTLTQITERAKEALAQFETGEKQ
jgi:hypothetical protein